MTTTNGAIALSALRERSLSRRAVGPAAPAARTATGLRSDRAMVAYVMVKETATALAITALVLAAILL